MRLISLHNYKERTTPFASVRADADGIAAGGNSGVR